MAKKQNTNLHKAKKAKNDEFYTQLTDIEKEMRHYKKHLKGKTVYCNCDDPMESNFFKYFVMNFNILGIKKLITTSYEGTEQRVVSITEVKDMDDNGTTDMEDVKIWLKKNPHASVKLVGDGEYPAGDFRSEQCLDYLKEADIVVTNPPFSLFREYVATLMEYKKKFIIVGNLNAITYKEVFPFIKENKLWLGVTNFNVGMYFKVPKNFKYSQTYKFERERNGEKVSRVAGVCWFTNLSHNKRNEKVILVEKYKGTRGKYPKYDNYKAIEVSKVKNIPKDYDGVMGVPITFLDKYNPDQFQVLGMAASSYNPDIVGIPFYGDKDGRPLIKGKNTYARIFIKRKKQPTGERK